MNIVLIGFKNSGKTTVGTSLAFRLGHQFIDTDDAIEIKYFNMHRKQLSVREIYKLCGEQYFRQLEKEIILGLHITRPTILATGGGSILDKENVKRLKQLGTLVYLSLPLEKLVDRALSQPSLPAFINPDNPLHSTMSIFEKRRSIYQNNADTIIDCQDKSPDAIAEEILELSTILEQSHG